MPCKARLARRANEAQRAHATPWIDRLVAPNPGTAREHRFGERHTRTTVKAGQPCG